jgi:hypothetical protein
LEVLPQDPNMIKKWLKFKIIRPGNRDAEIEEFLSEIEKAIKEWYPSHKLKQDTKQSNESDTKKSSFSLQSSNSNDQDESKLLSPETQPNTESPPSRSPQSLSVEEAAKGIGKLDLN